jgi:heme/copper-type cytochrome/quinol oxidase subunit 4
MMVQTFAIVIIEYGLIHVDQYTEETLNEALASNSRLVNLVGWGSVLQIIGCIALPIFALLLVEGFLHTSDFRKYFLGMLLCAVVSEIPYDLATNLKIGDNTSQNAMFGMCVCLLMMYFMQALKEKGGLTSLLQLPVVASAIVLVVLLQVQYGLILVFLVTILYAFRERETMKLCLGILVSALYLTAPLGLFGVWMYSGERKNIIPKYAYYIFYPAHYLILWGIYRFFLVG